MDFPGGIVPSLQRGKGRLHLLRHVVERDIRWDVEVHAVTRVHGNARRHEPQLSAVRGIRKEIDARETTVELIPLLTILAQYRHRSPLFPREQLCCRLDVAFARTRTAQPLSEPLQRFHHRTP